MVSNKLLSILASFSVKEMKQFEKFVHSPYFNENGTLKQLVQLLQQAHPNFEEESMRKEWVWKHLFPKVAFDDLKFRRYVSDLVKLAEQFMAIQLFQQKRISERRHLLEALNDRGLEKYFPNYLKYTRLQLEDQPFRDGDYYYDLFRIESEYNRYLEKQLKRTAETNLEEALHNIDVFFLVSKLSYWCAILNYKNVVGREHQVFLMDEILQHLQTRPFDHIPAIAIYYQVLLTLTESDNEAHFYKLTALLEEHANKFSVDEARKMYVFAQNYCLRRINQGSPRFLNSLFNLYKSSLEKEVILENGILSPWAYKNMITAGLRLNEVEWVRQFIEGYQNNLEPRFRENAYNYNLAKLYFHIKEFPKVLQQLQLVEFSDVFYSLDSRALLLKTYYELDELESLYSLIESFRLFLRRNRHVSEHHKTNYLNLVRYVKRITRLRPNDKKKLEAIRTEINGATRIADGNWLREKVNAL